MNHTSAIPPPAPVNSTIVDLDLNNKTQIQASYNILQTWVFATKHLATMQPTEYLSSLSHAFTMAATKVIKQKGKKKF
jgi:hypothetical protein